jgi:cell division protein FtsQ
MTAHAPPGGPLLPPNRRVRRSRPPEGPVMAPEEGTQSRVSPAPVPPSARESQAGERLRAAAGLLVTIATALACVWALVRYTSTSRQFAIRTIKIEGSAHLTPADITRIAGITLGGNVVTADLQSVRYNLLNDPWIEQATVTRRLPGTIVIEVVEREPAALVAIGSELYLSTQRGEPFKKLAPGDPYDFPIVTGIRTDDVVRDRAGVVVQIKRALELAAEYQHAGPGRSLPVQEVHLEDDGGLVLVVGKEPIELRMGKGPYRQAIEQAARVLSEVRERHAQASVIFLDNDAHPERVVVRMR